MELFNHAINEMSNTVKSLCKVTLILFWIVCGGIGWHVGGLVLLESKETTMKIFITYDIDGDEPGLYILDVTDKDTLARIISAHGNYGNTDSPNEDDATWLGDFLETQEKLPLDSGEPISIEGCSLAIHSGFCL